MNDVECITCEYVNEQENITFYCGHPDLPKKHKKKGLLIKTTGHSKHCPIANIINKELEKMFNER